MSYVRKIHIIGGGTFFNVRPHLSLAAPAFGTVARQIAYECSRQVHLMGHENSEVGIYTHLTRMAYEKDHDDRALSYCYIHSNEYMTPYDNADVAILLDQIKAESNPSIIFLTAALCDYMGSVEGDLSMRLKTSDGPVNMNLIPTRKLVKEIRKDRKDIYLVAFKTTANATDEEMYKAGLLLLKTSSCNLVVVNDIIRRQNMIVNPEQAHFIYRDRNEMIKDLVKITLSRCEGTFTKSTIVPGLSVDWLNPQIPSSLRIVIDHCISEGAYKDLLNRNTTVGHFAVKISDHEIFTSKRNTNFNKLSEVGLVKVVPEGNDLVFAYGSKPSVGAQSQRIIFKDHPEMDCIVHFHCPLKEGVTLPVRPQWKYECGSHECGQNTSDGLQEVEDGIKVVYLENHGPNIVFNRNIDPRRVIDFIDRHFDLSRHTGQLAA